MLVKSCKFYNIIILTILVATKAGRIYEAWGFLIGVHQAHLWSRVANNNAMAKLAEEFYFNNDLVSASGSNYRSDGINLRCLVVILQP